MGDRPVRVLAAACDGACSGNPGPGGWGALLRFEDGSRRELGGAAQATTNNRMELTAALAVLEALRDLPRHPDLVLRTDSRYLIDGYEKWMAGWKRKGWRTASGGAVLNRDLWELLDAARLPGLALRHVRGHSGDPDNDRCDAIAVAFSRGQAPALAVETQPSLAPQSEARDLAPTSLQELLSRMELADRLAAGGYSLRAVELARLLEVPTATLEGKEDPWLWRDWLVRPLGNGNWRLERGAGGLARPQ
ncbi:MULTISPECIES: ribonuclease H [unclassified Cyanobium]|uniref:ribonuclease H family protein n=1 Tax=unclassified Cyanobium TaxID=2627006 RepID=UPI0020CC7AD0|nr:MULTISPECIES: ribonuclease H [unclassified Cyanobium]MCP9833966.1 ribonuclease HI [Cyanobium sp. La Preciosa 7G6]MCP9936729.1 ribonuclease HI [Cyanobium sp. Aljojuca 7A6]